METFTNFSTFIATRLKKNPHTALSKISYQLGIIIITIGLAFIICSFLIMRGFHINMETRITDLTGDINIVQIYKYKTTTLSNQHLLSKIKQTIHSHKIDTKTTALKIGLIQNQDNLEGITLYGLDNNSNHKNIEKYLIKGSLPDLTNKDQNKLAISNILAKKLNISIGDDVFIFFIKNPSCIRLKISGIYNTSFPDFDEKFAFCDLRLIQKSTTSDPADVEGISIYFKTKRDIEKYAKSLKKELKSVAEVITTKETYRDIFDWITVLYINTDILTLLLFAIILTNLISIMYIQFVDRLYMIAVMRSIGISKIQIISIFVKYIAHMVYKGMIYGNAVAMLACIAQYCLHIVKLNPQIYYIDHVPINWNWPMIITINLTITVITLLTIAITQIIILKQDTISIP